MLGLLRELGLLDNTMRHLSEWERKRQNKKDWWNAMGIAIIGVPGFTLAFILFIEFLSYCGLL